MAALTDAQKKAIRKELQRLAQAKMAWKAGGGTGFQSASMKGWKGFGQGGASKADQLAYIKQLNTKKAGADSAWKKSYTAAAKKNIKKGGASVKTYIKKKGGDTATKGTSPSISKNKPAPKPKVTKTGYTANQKAWYKKHVDNMAKSGKTKKQIRDTLKKKVASGKLK